MVFAPVGRSASVIIDVLAGASISATRISTPDQLAQKLAKGEEIDLLILVAETLTREVTDLLEEASRAQPLWSNLPVLLLARPDSSLVRYEDLLERLAPQLAVTVLSRPVRKATLVSVTRLALADRGRQHTVRDLVAEQRRWNRQLEEEVREQTAEVRKLARRLGRAERQERKRISQLLHDHLQQLLYGAQMALHFIERKEGRHSQNAHLDKLDGLLDQAIILTRRLTVELSPPVLKDEGLPEALEWLAGQLEERHDLEVGLDLDRSLKVTDEDMRELLYQVARELLFNVVKHADGAPCTIITRMQEREFMLTVEDRGPGFETESLSEEEHDGFGLVSILERVRLMGGRVTLDTSPGEGTSVSAFLPSKRY